MNFKSFIKDKILLCFLLLFGIATIEIFLIPYPFGNFIKIYIPVAIIFIYIIGLTIEYFMKQRFYKGLENNLNNLDDKYLISEIIKVFVSIPSKDPTKPSTHNTGGAIDFSICDSERKELNFGCGFDDFHAISGVTYFEKKYKNGENLTDSEIEAMLNRRVLSNIGAKVGFALYESE